MSEPLTGSTGAQRPLRGAGYSFNVVHPGSPAQRVRYRDGIVFDGYGFPDWMPYARAVVELPAPAATRTVDETRVLDVLTANHAMRSAGDPLWSGVPAWSTPPGWAWAHVAMSRRIALVPIELYGSLRHLGGVSTIRVERTGGGLDTAGGQRVDLHWTERVHPDGVAKVEEHLGYPFPPAYRAFLVSTNGGHPAAAAVHPRFGFLVDQPFFGLVRSDPLETLHFANDWFADRLTPDHLGIGYVQGGLIVLRVQGPDAGSVWYLDDDDPRDSDDYGPAEVCARLLHRCADDLDAFWAALRLAPYPLRRLAVELVAAGAAGPVAVEGAGASLPRNRRAPEP